MCNVSINIHNKKIEKRTPETNQSRLNNVLYIKTEH